MVRISLTHLPVYNFIIQSNTILFSLKLYNLCTSENNVIDRDPLFYKESRSFEQSMDHKGFDFAPYPEGPVVEYGGGD